MDDLLANGHTWLTRGALQLSSAALVLVLLLWLLVAWALR
jgi:hypothetical protein